MGTTNINIRMDVNLKRDFDEIRSELKLTTLLRTLWFGGGDFVSCGVGNAQCRNAGGD